MSRNPHFNMWNLKPGTCTLDVDDDAVVQDHGAREGTATHPEDISVPASSRVTVIDSDSEDNIWDEMNIRNPLTPRLRPQDPVFGFTECLLLRFGQWRSWQPECYRENTPLLRTKFWNCF